MSEMSEKVVAKAPWARSWGYSRAVRRGNLIEVSGTTAVDEQGNVVGVGDLFRQTEHALATIVAAVEQLGGSGEDVVRTRLFLREIDDWQAAGRAHLAVFGDVLPASSAIGGAEFLHADILVEIEATAVLAG